MFAALALMGCGAPLDPPGGGRVDSGVRSDTGALDAGVMADVGTVVDSGCPAPERITPAQVPASGFLPAQSVELIRTVDGDTAHFSWPVLGDLAVRMLWVNTEESHGAETTAFGTATAARVAGYLRDARALSLVAQQRANMPGVRQLDPYDRTLSLVFADGELFQQRLVREGLSAYYTQFGCAPEPLHTALLRSEAEARANQRGIWALGHPTNYGDVLSRWGGSRPCRPNPFRGQPYCS